MHKEPLKIRLKAQGVRFMVQSSKLKAQSSKVKGQRSKVKGQRSKVKGQSIGIIVKAMEMSREIGWKTRLSALFLGERQGYLS